MTIHQRVSSTTFNDNPFTQSSGASPITSEIVHLSPNSSPIGWQRSCILHSLLLHVGGSKTIFDPLNAFFDSIADMIGDSTISTACTPSSCTSQECLVVVLIFTIRYFLPGLRFMQLFLNLQSSHSGAGPLNMNSVPTFASRTPMSVMVVLSSIISPLQIDMI